MISNKNVCGGGGRNKIKQAFTLAEMSVVIVIVSIALALILISKSLIDIAKVNGVYGEYRNLNNAISMFYNQYECLPWDCNANIAATFNLPAACTAPSTVVFTPSYTTVVTNMIVNNNIINSSTKRTCMMYSLQLAGFIGGVDPTYIANPTVANGPLSTNNLADSVAGKNMPFAKFSKNAAWDYLYLLGGTPVGGVGPASSTYTGSAPAEFILSVFSGNGSTTSLANTIVGNHAIILRDANIKIGSASSTTNTPGNPGLYGSYYSATSIRNLYSSDVQSGISSYLSQKLDSKFDDGMPLTGNIFAGKGGISSAAGTGSNPGDNHPEICHSAIGVTFPITTPYNKNNNTLNGCVMGFLVKNET